MIVRLLILALCLVLGDTGALGQVRVRAVPSSTTVYYGESFDLTIEISANTLVETPPDASGVTEMGVEYLGAPSRFTNSFNGRVSATIRHVFRLTPRRTGRQTIPPVRVSVGGREYNTQPVEVNVIEPTETEDFKLRLAASVDQAFVGEPTRVRLTWYYNGDIRDFAELSLPDESRPFETIVVRDPTVTQADLNNRRVIALPFNDADAFFRQATGQLAGKTYRTLSTDIIVIPRAEGPLEIGPAFARFGALPPGARRATRLVIPSNVLRLSVSDVPVQGRPDAYNGLVGHYQVESRIDRTSVSVGDPIELTVTVRGPEPTDAIRAPSLERQPEFMDGFKPSPEGWTPAASSAGRRTFTTTIRATHDGVTEVPSIQLPYFDTDTRSFAIAASAPIPIDVAPTREVTLADAIGGAGSAGIAREPGVLLPTERGLWANDESSGGVRNESVGLLALFTHPLWISTVIGPPLLCATALLLVRRRERNDVTQQRRRRSLARARAALMSDLDSERIDAVIRGYVADVFNHPDGGLSNAESIDLLRNGGAARVEELEAVLDWSDRSRFDQSPDARAPYGVREIQSILSDIDRSLRKAGR